MKVSTSRQALLGMRGYHSQWIELASIGRKRAVGTPTAWKVILGIVAAVACSASTVSATSTPWEIVALPDTQYYSASHPEIFDAQTSWIVDNRTAENIAFVTHLGDVVDSRDNTQQWTNAEHSMNILEIGAPELPYSVCMGNHDFLTYPKLLGTSDTSRFSAMFGSSRYEGESWYPTDPANGRGGVDHYQIFSAGGYSILNINLSYAPSDDEISWAQGVISANPGKPTIISTHDYLRADGSRSPYYYNDLEIFGIPVGWDVHGGEYIWQKLVQDNSQIFLVLCGHDYGSGQTPGAARLLSENNAARPVLQVLSDYQNMDNGGDGYLRKVIFDPGTEGRGTISFQTYSPTTDTYRTNGNDAFQYDVVFGASIHVATPLKTWLGAPDTQWNRDPLTQAWQEGSYAYSDGEQALFDDTAVGKTVLVTETVRPLTMVVNNSADNDYTINSSSDGLSGKISGDMILEKKGPGTLVLTGTNDFTGGTKLTGGTIVVNAPANLGDGSGVLTIGAATLELAASFSSARPIVLSDSASTIQVDSGLACDQHGAISGAGNLNKTGAGKVTLTSANSYMGLTSVEAGTLELALMAQAPVLTGGGADIQGGELVLNYAGGSSSAATVRSLLTASYATGFASGQIFSSTATMALGLGWVDDMGASELTIAYSLYGDTNLDGSVDFADLSKLLAGYNQAGDWAQGDSDYTGAVAFADLSKMLANYNQSLPGSINVGSYNLDAAAIQALSDAGITVVPEPASLLLLVMAGLGLLAHAWHRHRS